MGISRSLSIGSSSLRTHQLRFDVIANNLANANTTGFKAGRANFLEQFNQTYFHGRMPESPGNTGVGGKDPLQYGLGVKMGSIQKDMSQGALETTNRPLDLAMQGDGLFIYQLNGQDFYSRAGAISVDKLGFFTDSSTGALLQGYNIVTDAGGRMIKDSNGLNIVNNTLAQLHIAPNVVSSPNQTQNVAIAGNLNAQAAEGSERSTSIKIFDNSGGARQLMFTFTKTANPNEFTVAATIDGNDVALSSNNITFNNDGTLNSPLTLDITAANLNAAMGTQIFDETEPKDISVMLANPQNLLSGITQFSGPNTVTASSQDGYQSGDLISLSVDEKGKVWGAFTNGQSEVLGQVAIARFANPEGLLKAGNNFYSISPNSGDPIIGTAGEIFRSTQIISNALEMSNVDMTTQFTDMIATQRAFEAAARTITVSDQLLAETTLLKR